MKLSPRDANAFFRKPDPGVAGLLIYGEDVMRVAMKRQEVVAAIVGPEGEAEMRLTRLVGGDLRRDPAQLLDAVKAQGFFPGPRAVLVEEAADGISAAMKSALGDWREGDAQIIATAGQLTARSSLRKLFEGAKNAYAAALYNDPMGRAEIEAELARAGLKNIDREAMGALEHLARDLTPGDFRQTLEKIALYKFGDEAPLTPDEVTLNAPASIEAQMDEIFHVLAEGRTGDIAPVMQRLTAQGVAPVTLLIMGMRHFRTLFAIASAPGGPAQGIGKLRPPIFGPRRDRMLRQAQSWSSARLEEALKLLMDTDLTLRSAGQKAPQMALVERAFVRLAYLGRR
ncbi:MULTISPECIES: DNA polymerase III subunit delta [Mameliella]|uniref:DNA-directed DNA polymerase n=1 Tax=Mameliella alba TaxID=561184 RepID=A0A0B3S767_9RHOB|nr:MULTISPECIES: DNA polymerase III subunit delta [Mameliella]MCR9272285.1 DNA polymerase III subunit delta [Paracoccaceae bacterium]KHQ54823.1 DNA polymerase III subunit delta [Mameliella alba]MBY6117593.1 DNA polymerase III subunit delta [Mameliella alba]OWV44604.1 DNA polymerase III subunit delta [Mameliella alba]OWV48637.1 DNA polymerase III subunit delta [Mameliella alba]